MSKKTLLTFMGLVFTSLVLYQSRPRTIQDMEVTRCINLYSHSKPFIQEELDANPKMKKDIFSEAGVTTVDELIQKRCERWVSNGQHF